MVYAWVAGFFAVIFIVTAFDKHSPTKVKVGFALAGAVLAFITLFAAAPVDWKITYEVKDGLSSSKIYIEDKPDSCDFERSPMGTKDCHFVSVVTYSPTHDAVSVLSLIHI